MLKVPLYRLTSLSFKLPFHVDYAHQVILSNAAELPTITWPNGHWCFAANSYLLELYEKNLSRKQRGGTLAAYARNIGHLLRFCYANKIDVVDITDSLFTMFIRGLSAERKRNDPSKLMRRPTAVVTIGRRCLDFIQSVGHRYNVGDLVGPKHRVAALRKTVRGFPGKRGRRISSWAQSFWTHHSFPPPSPIDKRFSISSESIERLRDAVRPASTSLFLRKRRYVLLLLLEATGARRSELCALTVASVLRAAEMADPKLELFCAKRRGGVEVFRLVPIARHALGPLLEYIEMNRKGVVRRTCGKAQDGGLLFISQRTGKGLKPNTLTAEIETLRRHAGIVERIHPHMWRHRKAQKAMVDLLEQHDLSHKDGFRQTLVDLEAIKLVVSQLLGQKNPESLNDYLRDAITEYTNVEKTLDAAKLRQVVTSAKSEVKQLRRELSENDSSKSALASVDRFLTDLEQDLNSATA